MRAVLNRAAFFVLIREGREPQRHQDTEKHQEILCFPCLPTSRLRAIVVQKEKEKQKELQLRSLIFVFLRAFVSPWFKKKKQKQKQKELQPRSLIFVFLRAFVPPWFKKKKEKDARDG
jgi:hypothetical protein